MSSFLARRVCLAVLALSAVAACGKRSAAPAPVTRPAAAAADAPSGTAVAAAPPRAPVAQAPAASDKPLTDANIAAIVVAANNADITYGQLALGRGTSAAVKQYATMTVKDHQSVNAAAIALVTKLRLTPVDNAVSLDLRDQADEIRDRLRDLTGIEFDRAYADNEVRYHANLLETLEGTLIPSARNGELKSLLEQTAPAVRAHFRHAATLQASLRPSR